MPGFLRSEGIAGGAAAPPADTRPRLLITTDIGGDDDDRQSMVRFLSYANEFRIVGLIASSAGTPGETTPTPRTDLIDGHVNNYGSVRSNLAVHAPPDSDWPTASNLLAMVKAGWGSTNRTASNLVNSGNPTTRGDGWSWITAKVDESTEPLHVSIWGGAYDTAQAIHSASFSKSSGNFAAFKAKLRIYAIADQDGDTVGWIRANHPDVWLVLNGPGSVALHGRSISSFDRQFRGMHQNDSRSGVPLVNSSIFSLVRASWVTSNVHGHGALGAAYPTNVTAFPSTTENDLVKVKEGDTPSWFYFLRNGMNDPAQPTWGGWGGRFQLDASNYWTDGEELDHPTSADAREQRKWCIARWREEYQLDFQARMDWCNTGTFGSANHNPVAVLNGDTSKDIVQLSADGGATVNLSAAGSTDPDGNTLSYSWSHYRNVGHSTAISITGATSQACSFTAPNANTTVHIILKVRDDGSPNLTSYRRAVVTVTAVAPPGSLALYSMGSTSPTTTASGLTAGVLTTGAGLSAFLMNQTLGYATDPACNAQPVAGSTDAASTVTNNGYFSFTITPDGGKKLNLSSLAFKAARGGSGTPRGYVVRSSIDSFAANLAAANLATARPTFTDVSLDLTGASFQNLTAAITFRIYSYVPSAGQGVDYDEINVTGTVADV